MDKLSDFIVKLLKVQHFKLYLNDVTLPWSQNFPVWAYKADGSRNLR